MGGGDEPSEGCFRRRRADFALWSGKIARLAMLIDLPEYGAFLRDPDIVTSVLAVLLTVTLPIAYSPLPIGPRKEIAPLFYLFIDHTDTLALWLTIEVLDTPTAGRVARRTFGRRRGAGLEDFGRLRGWLMREWEWL